jgi:hypothetical protein
MLPLSTERLLEAWERGVGLDSVGRSRVLLGAGDPSPTEEEVGSLTAGRRDAALLRIRAAAFGPRAGALASCPACGRLVEFGFPITELIVGDGGGGDEPLRIRENGFDVRFRLPTIGDLAEIGAGADGVRVALLERCIDQARRRGKAVAVEDLSEQVIEAIEAEMERLDPNAEIAFALTCDGCEAAWSAMLDVPAFVWSEVDAWARRVLREVHALASAYGWSEREILDLTPARRQTYLELAAYWERSP